MRPTPPASRRPTDLARRAFVSFPLAVLFAVAMAGPAGCASEPTSVLQSDLPQVPGMVPRESSRIRQEGGRVTGGQFDYKGNVENTRLRARETRARFEESGWKLHSETLTPATAILEFRKDERAVTVEIVRNQLQPRMSTAVMRVWIRE
jgi:hypothetical protein